MSNRNTLEKTLLSTPNPTQDQQKALDDFFSFMISDATEYHLTGGAGVGKTFTLDLIMTEGMKRYEEACALFNVPQTISTMALTATTNKAAEVLANATKKPAVTIHTHMGFKVTEDYKTGETRITVKPGTMPKTNQLIIIDEASMIDSKLYELLGKYTHNCKFLYVGDHCQMAPVFEKLSKIYDNKQFFSNLIQPIRNAGQPALMDICSQFRETVETGVFKPIVPVPGVIDHVDGPTMEALVNQTFAASNSKARILCFRNAQVKAYNQYIRELRQLPDYFTEGEILVCANAYSSGTSTMNIEMELEVVKNHLKEEVKAVQGIEFNTYLLDLKKPNGAVITVNVPSDQEYFESLIKYFAGQKNWTAYFHLKNNYPDLRPRDASTVYKAQGSTYDMVFVDLDDISRCTHADQVARMLYVAVSRPKNRLILYGNLKPAYSGG